MRWEDLLNDQAEPAPAELPAPPDPFTALQDRTLAKMAKSLDVPAELLQQAPAIELPTWRLDGPEPPPGVVRLERATGLELARIPRERGEERGWWFVREGEVPLEPKGWLWGSRNPARARADVYRQAFPVIRELYGVFARALALALPWDNLWYQVGVTADAGTRPGVPVWASVDSDGDYVVHVGALPPGRAG